MPENIPSAQANLTMCVFDSFPCSLCAQHCLFNILSVYRWYFTDIDIRSTLANVCFKVLHDHSVSNTVLNERAKALKILGDCFIAKVSVFLFVLSVRECVGVFLYFKIATVQQVGWYLSGVKLQLTIELSLT